MASRHTAWLPPWPTQNTPASAPRELPCFATTIGHSRPWSRRTPTEGNVTPSCRASLPSRQGASPWILQAPQIRRECPVPKCRGRASSKRLCLCPTTTVGSKGARALGTRSKGWRRRVSGRPILQSSTRAAPHGCALRCAPLAHGVGAWASWTSTSRRPSKTHRGGVRN